MSLVNVTLPRTRHRRLCSLLNNTVKPFWGPKTTSALQGRAQGCSCSSCSSLQEDGQDHGNGQTGGGS